MAISLVQVPFSSYKCELAFDHLVQRGLLRRVDEFRSGSVQDYLEKLGWETIFLLFEECCFENGFEVGCDGQSQYFLLKKPMATIAANNIFDVIKRHLILNGVTQNDAFHVSDDNKSIFKTIADSYLNSRQGEWESFDGDYGQNFKFQDGSHLLVGHDSLTLWNCNSIQDENSFAGFVSRFAKKLDLNIMTENGDCESFEPSCK